MKAYHRHTCNSRKHLRDHSKLQQSQRHYGGYCVRNKAKNRQSYMLCQFEQHLYISLLPHEWYMHCISIETNPHIQSIIFVWREGTP